MSVFATGVSLGSLPGTDVREATSVVVGECPLPHVVELPARGVGADVIGRAAAIVVDIAIDIAPSGYRIASHRGSVAKAACGYLDQDVDTLEEFAERAGGLTVVKVSAPGPVTLAAQVELRSGHRVLTDTGARRDLAESLAEGIAVLRADIARRLGAQVHVQLDEPSLPSAIEGSLAPLSALSPVRALDAEDARQLLGRVLTRCGDDVLVHCCAPSVPWSVLATPASSAVSAVAIDPSLLTSSDFDPVGEYLQAGGTVVLGLVPSTGDRPQAPEVYAKRAAEFVDRLGFARRVLGTQIGISPSCGLAGATGAYARSALTTVTAAAEIMARDFADL